MVLGRSLAFCLLGLLLASVGLGKEIWPDEAHSLYYYTGDWGRLSGCPVPPFFFVLAGILNPEKDPMLARLFSLAIFGLALGVFCYATRKLKTISFCAGGMVLFTNPIILRYAVEIRAYGAVVFLSLAGLAMTCEKPSRSRPRLLVLLMSLGLLPLTHPIGLLSALATLIVWYLVEKETSLKHLGLGLATIFVSFGSWYVAFKMSERLTGGDWIPSPTAHLITNMVLQVVLGKTDISYWCPLPGGRLLPWTSAICLAILLCSLLAIGLRRFHLRDGGLPFLAGAFTQFALILLVSFMAQPLMVARMFIGLVPFLALFVAFQIEQVDSRGLTNTLFSLALLASFAQAARWWAWEGRLAVEPWSELVEIVRHEPGPKQILSKGITWYLMEYHFRDWPKENRLTGDDSHLEQKILPSATIYLFVRNFDSSRIRQIRDLLARTRTEERVSSTQHGVLYRYPARSDSTK